MFQKYQAVLPTLEQCELLLKSLKLGLQKSMKEKAADDLNITAGKYLPHKRNTNIDEYLLNEFNNNKVLSSEAELRKSGSYPHVYIKFKDKNLSVTYKKMNKEDRLPEPSKYRGEYACLNMDRLEAEGIKVESRQISLFKEDEKVIQIPFKFHETPKEIPFGLTLIFGVNSDDSLKFARLGALNLDQDDWLFCFDLEKMVTNKVFSELNDNVVHYSEWKQQRLTVNEHSNESDNDIPLKLNRSALEELRKKEREKNGEESQES